MSAADPRPDPAELLAQRAWMRRFAAALAGGEGEDVAQDAWVRVLSRPLPALARPRAWLASVLRTTVRMRAREHARRTHREHRSAPEERFEPPTAELAARAELE
jgi:DNA-directed RNA polymerase specialized sigma24 family protein